jgi:hypothetical protein
MSSNDDDIKISPAQRAYLAAFDNWLHSSWKMGAIAEGKMVDGATELKDAAFDHMLADAGVHLVATDPSLVRGKHRQPHLELVPRPTGEQTCTECGGRFVRETNMGRPRVKCYSCRPAWYGRKIRQAEAMAA